MADVTTTFAAKDESFAKTVDNLQNRLSGFQGQTEGFSGRVASLAGEFAKFAIPIAGVAAAFLGAKNMVAAFSDAIRIGGQLNDLSARTGETAGNLAVLQRAFENAGSSADAVGPMINRLQRFIAEAGVESSTQAKTLAELGVSAETLGQKSPLEQMKMLAELVAGVEDPTKRTQLAIDLFGKSGGELIPLLRAMGVELDTARKQLGSYPAAIDATREALDTIGDNFTAISNKATEFATGLLTKLAPSLAEITTKIAEIDAAGFGMMLADYFDKMIRAASEAFKLGSAIENIKLAIEAITSGNFGEGLSLMWVTMKVTALNAINEIASNFTAAFMTIRDFIATMFDSQGALAHLMNTLFSTAANYMKEQLYGALASFMEAIGRMGMAEAFRIEAETARNVIEMNMKGIGAQFELVGEQAAAAGRAMPENFEKNKASLQPIFDLTPVLQEQQALHTSIEEKLALQKTSTEAINSAGAGYAASLGIANAALESSGPLSAQIALNLTSASTAAEKIAPAFDLGKASSDTISFNLETTSTYAEKSSEWLKEGSDHSGNIDIHGQSFANNIKTAKGDIQAAVDLMVGPNGLTERFNAAMDRVAQLKDAINTMKAAGEKDAAMRERERNADSDMRRKERSDDYAAQLERQGSWSAADNRRQRAEEDFNRSQMADEYEMNAKMLKQQEYERAAQEKSLSERLDKQAKADEAYAERMEKMSAYLDQKEREAADYAYDKELQGAENFFENAEDGGQKVKQGGSDAGNSLKNAVKGLDKMGKDGGLALEVTLQACRDFLKSIDEKLPQHALS